MNPTGTTYAVSVHPADGSVAALVTVADEEAAIAAANHTVYRLGGSSSMCRR